ncbi:Cathepsin R, partial [Fragariocoptes setiger]
KSDYYQSINILFDRFQSEIDGMYPRNSGFAGSLGTSEGKDELRYGHPESTIQEQQLEQGMAKIIDERRPGYEIIVEAMEDEAHNIQKRSIEISERILTEISDRKLKRKVRNEIRKPKSSRLSPKLVYSLDPTNPFYEQPVVKSKSTVTNTEKSLDKKEVSRHESSLNKGDELVDNEWHNLERKMLIGESDKNQSIPHNEATVGKSIDWRKTNCFSPIKHQHTCGSCTYFAIVALLEYEHCVQQGSLVQFSEQYLIDCGLRVDKDRFSGCDGAHFQYMNLLVLSYGLEIENMYPYEGANGECAVPSSLKAHQRGRLRLTISDNIFIRDVNITKLDSMLERGPVVASVYAPEDFESCGGGGPHDGNNCSMKKGHTMLIIGSGVSHT